MKDVSITLERHPSGKLNSPMTSVTLMSRITVWFSYSTPVVFCLWDRGAHSAISGIKHMLFVRKNIWGRTTGRHIKWVLSMFGSPQVEPLDSAPFEEALMKGLRGEPMIIETDSDYRRIAL